MLLPKRMKKFYVAVPRDKEDEVLETLGRLGVVEFISQARGSVKGEGELELYSAFLRLFDRVNIAINSINELLPIEEGKKPFLERFRDAFKIRKKKAGSKKISPSELVQFVKTMEDDYNKLTEELESKRRRLNELAVLIDNVDIMRKNGVSLDIAGDYIHIFVRVGFIPEVNADKLMEALKPYNVVVSLLKGRPKEYLLLIAASQKDKEGIMAILTALNFEEITVPKDMGSDPELVYNNLVREQQEIIEGLSSLRKEFERLREEFYPYLKYIRFMYRVKSMLVRTRNFSVIYGWVPSDHVKNLEASLHKVTKGLMHIEVSDPGPGDNPPTMLSQIPLFDKFQLIVRMRGVPNYNEVDPTIPFTILFSIMYGMMFGDVGQGVILLIIGLMLYRIKKPFLGISYTALNKLGAILSTASIVSIFFGFLYGESFLVHFMHPLWLNPMEEPLVIAVASIIFGLIQLNIGLIINIVNNVINRDYAEALLGWRGLVGMIYYLIGIVLAIRFVTGNMSLSVFGAPENFPLVMVELGLLIFIFLKPTILNLFSKHRHPFSESLMEGISEFIEMFLSYITNSISYIRLGAFAIAHVALASVAGILANSMGFIPSYLIFNIIVILIEGFAAGIQSIRLLFYEFSTKFYIDDGRLFRPMRL